MFNDVEKVKPCINVKGIVNCIFDEIFEEVQNEKHIFTEEIPTVFICSRLEHIKIEDIINKGITCGMYDPVTKSIFVFEDSLNEIFRKEDVWEEAVIARTLAHELSHYLQDIEGEEFDESLPYEQRPYEIEAFKISNRVSYNYYEKYYF